MPGNAIHFGNDGPERASPPERSGKGRIAVPGKPRIVIIEDEFLVAWDLQAVLRDLDFDFCEIASDAESGVDLAIEQEAELLLADLNLGSGPDGVEAARRISEYRDVAVIFITAYTDESNLSRIRRLMPDAPILAKPVSPHLLAATIRKLFPLV